MKATSPRHFCRENIALKKHELRLKKHEVRQHKRDSVTDNDTKDCNGVLAACPLKLVNHQENNVTLFDTLHLKALQHCSTCSTAVCQGSVMASSHGEATKCKVRILEEAKDFLQQYFNQTLEKQNDQHAYNMRWREVRQTIESSGTYEQTSSELIFGAKTAWRNASRCIGRIQWSKLQVFDLRKANSTYEMYQAVCNHLRYATNEGNIRSTVTVFGQSESSAIGQVWNAQYIRYAGYERDDGSILGDPASVALTKICLKLGWKAKGERTCFDVLPLVLSVGDNDPDLFELPPELVKQVPLVHPRFPKFAELRLRWYAVPVVSNMGMSCGGIYYPSCGFNGWYQSTEIVRNLCDMQRYNLLKEIAKSFDLDPSQPTVLWKDTALIELNFAVLYSFQAQRVTIVDQYSTSESFITHMRNEHNLRGGCPADWVWIVPPIGSAATAVFHQEMLNYKLLPSYEYQMEPWVNHSWKNITIPPRRKRLTLFGVATAIRFCTGMMKAALALRVPCTILYATETGKSEKFARALHSRFATTFRVKTVRMDEYACTALNRESLVLVVTSTFGNGQAPENGQAFYEFLQAMRDRNNEASHQNESAEGHEGHAWSSTPRSTIYAVFGLGSRAFPNYCAFALAVDKLLSDIGCQRLASLATGDEMCNQEGSFETWSDEVFKLALAAFKLPGAFPSSNLAPAIEKGHGWNPNDWKLEKLALGKTVSSVQALSQLHERPLSEFRIIKVEFANNSQNRIIQVRLSVPQEFVFSPGDHIALFPENDDHHVDAVLKRVSFNNAGDSFTADTPLVLYTASDIWMGQREWQASNRIPACTARTAVKQYLDLTSAPTMNILKAVAAYASDRSEQDTLRELSQDDEKYKRWRDSYNPSIVDMLDMFPSLTLPAELLLSTLPILQPRYYSVSSSPSKHPHELHLTVSVVQYTVLDGRNGVSFVTTKLGLCSNWLMTRQPGAAVAGFIRQMKGFHVPSSPATPIIMICQGSGIAPFRAFWQHRQQLNRKVLGDDQELGEAHLYYGCRTEEDVPYRPELEECCRDGSLTSVSFAFSMSTHGPKARIQQEFRKHASKVIDILCKRMGHVYLCGNVDMAYDASQTIVEILRQNVRGTDVTSDDAEARTYLQKLKSEGRFHEDIFGVEWRHLNGATFLNEDTLSLVKERETTVT